MMFVISSVVRRRRIRKYHIVSDVVVSNAADVERLGIKDRENRRWCLIVEIFVFPCDQQLTERRIALTTDLDEFARVLWSPWVAQDGESFAASGSVHTDYLLVTAQFRNRNVDNNGVHVKSSLAV